MNMAVGAGFAGVRSMTATSGGGFSLNGRSNRPSGNDGDAARRVLVHGADRPPIADEDGAGRSQPRPGAGQGDWPRAILPRVTRKNASLSRPRRQSRRDLPDADHRDSDLYLGEGFRTWRNPISTCRSSGHDGRDGGPEGLSALPITESGVSPRRSLVRRVPVHRSDGRAYGERGLISDVLSGLPEFVGRAGGRCMRSGCAARRIAEGHSPSEIWGSQERGPHRDPVGSTWGAAHEAILEWKRRRPEANTLEFPTHLPSCGRDLQCSAA